MKFTFVINFGKNGGLHIRQNKGTGSFGICFWHLAFTFYKYDIEESMALIPSVEAIANSFMLAFDENRGEETNLVATSYKHKKPCLWAIRRSGFCMSKINGDFYQEPLPSNRTDDFYHEFRFVSIEEAERIYISFHCR